MLWNSPYLFHLALFMSTFFVTYLPHNLAPGTIILNAVKRPLPLSKGPLHEHTFSSTASRWIGLTDFSCESRCVRVPLLARPMLLTVAKIRNRLKDKWNLVSGQMISEPVTLLALHTNSFSCGLNWVESENRVSKDQPNYVPVASILYSNTSA